MISNCSIFDPSSRVIKNELKYNTGYCIISSVLIMEFVKRLSPSEAKYKYVGLPKTTREEFPEKDMIFKLKFKNKTYDMKVNNKNSIMLTQLYEVYQFQQDDEIQITSKNGSSFELKVNES